MGGPIKQDKAFFFASVQRYYATTDPIGPVANSTDISPRLNMKFTLQPTTNDTFILGFQYDQYNLTGRVGVLAGVAGDRPADGDGGRARVGVERAVAARLRDQRTARGEVHRLRRLLLPRSGRSVAVYTVDAETGTYCGGGGGGLYYADRVAQPAAGRVHQVR